MPVINYCNKKEVVDINWLDFLIVFIVGGYALIGLRAGFLGGLARLLGALLGLAAAINFYRPLADTLNLKWNLAAAIGGLIPVSAFGARGKLMPSPTDLIYPFKAPPEAGSQALAPQGPLYALQGLGESVVKSLASGILDVLCFVIIFLVVSWTVKTLGVMLGKVASVFLLGPADRVLGVLLGAVKGCVVAAVLVALGNSLQVPAAFFSTGNSNWISLALQKSLLAPYFIKALVVLNVKFPGWGI